MTAIARVKLTDVTAGYAHETVVRGVSLEITAGQILCLLGPNGAGKSTLLKVMAGQLSASGGQLEVCGRDVAELPRREHAALVAMVAQRSELAHGFSVRQVVAMGRAPHQGAWLRASRQDEQVVDEAIATCSLETLAERQLDELSGGELQRVHLARALCQQTPVLLLDEVAAHLDVRHAVTAYSLLRQQVASRQLACVAVMHDLNAAARYADRVVLLRDGQLFAEGTPREVMTEARLAEVYGTTIMSADADDGHPYFVARATD